MLQVNVTNYASDALEDAMRLAQTKALNSYTFSDCVQFLNYAWADIYARMAAIDSGYYSKTVRLTSKLTKLPPFVKNTIRIYSAQDPSGFNRQVYRSAGQSDIVSSNTYKISGTELYCFDADRRSIWLEYVPQPAQLFFTHMNRDPIIHDECTELREKYYNMYQLYGYLNDTNFIDISIMDTPTKTNIPLCLAWKLIPRTGATVQEMDISNKILKDGWDLVYITCDYPYIFCSYMNKVTGEYKSGFYDHDLQWNDYNPFDFIGRGSNVEYIRCKWNDKTGMGVVIKDHNDIENNVPKIKELGWTPDMKLIYPCPEMYRYLVARLAEKFSALNESNVMGVQLELAEARYAFESLLNKNKSAWSRITNVNTPTINDWL